MELKIEYLPPDKLKPYENNTRKHTPDDIEGIKKSIIDTGFNDPIGIWGKDNLIVEGHGRQIAALEMGLKTVPCIRLDHMTDEQRREYAIRHNRSAELSAWDFQKLEEELAQLSLDGVDMDDLNFDIDQGELFDYMKNDPFIENKTEPDSFIVSLEIPIQYREDFDEYLKNNGKEELVNSVVGVVENA